MITSAPEFLYLGFVLPSLFAVTLVGEGIYKIIKHESGFFMFLLGILFLIGVMVSYFFIF